MASNTGNGVFTTESIESSELIRKLTVQTGSALPPEQEKKDPSSYESDYYESDNIIGGIANIISSYDTSEQEDPSPKYFNKPEVSKQIIKEMDLESQLIIRSEFVNEIIPEIKGLIENHGHPSANGYAFRLFEVIRRMRDVLVFDPFTTLIMAFFDALVHENKWAEYTKDQFERANNIIIGLAGRKFISDDTIDKEIVKLDSIGFNLLPYGDIVEIDFE